jgi:hypothetical protein
MGKDRYQTMKALMLNLWLLVVAMVRGQNAYHPKLITGILI